METEHRSFIKRFSTLILILLALSITTGILVWKHITAPVKKPDYYELCENIVDYPKFIHGKIVTLEKLSIEHVYDTHAMFSDTVRFYLDFPLDIDLSYTYRYLSGQILKQEKNLLIAYSIFDNKTDKLIGAINIREPNATDPGQLGMWLNEYYWGGGRIQEAIYMISRAYFAVRKDTNVYNAHVMIKNPRSYNALKKFGFKDVDRFYENEKVTRYILEMYRDVIDKKTKDLQK